MSETDSFITEVTEEVRRDRMYGLWKRYAPFVFGTLALTVLGVGLWSYLEDRKEKTARSVGAQFYEAANAENPLATAEALTTVAEGAGGPAMLARFRSAAAFTEAGETEKALAQFEAIASMTDITPEYRDLAVLKGVALRIDDGDADALIHELKAVPQTSRWAFYANELMAAAALRKGDTDTAIAALRQVEGGEKSPAQAQARARRVLAALEAGTEDDSDETNE